MTAHGMTDLVVSWRAALQALPPLLHVDIALSAAQTVSATTTLTLATGRVTALTHHGGCVAKVTEKEKEDICLLHGICFIKGCETTPEICEHGFVFLPDPSEQVSTQVSPCLKNPGLQVTHSTLW